jgi:hypothetical protein
VDNNDPSWKLADASFQTLRGDHEAFDRALTELRPTSRTLARAYALGLYAQPFISHGGVPLILEKRLQVALMEEHVAAQRRMGRTINRLTFWLVVLTLALVVFATLDLGQKLHWFGDRRPQESGISDPALGPG